MHADQINREIAERLGWELFDVWNDDGTKRLKEGFRSPDGKFWPKYFGCFTTPTAEWCEHVLGAVLKAGATVDFVGSGYDTDRMRDVKNEYCVDMEEPIGPRVWNPDLYTAVALAFLAMGEEK